MFQIWITLLIEISKFKIFALALPNLSLDLDGVLCPLLNPPTTKCSVVLLDLPNKIKIYIYIYFIYRDLYISIDILYGEQRRSPSFYRYITSLWTPFLQETSPVLQQCSSERELKTTS
ncbi:hypothetical protein KIL84_005960 [Mauremys mutica]|uniref:Uncharacterized protein n=1 Tax=Mauremys mutica TaxID=74926 RepID=A0A9D4B4G7_9SAUR|nr:hypothetical protein KIL84_005960 [Mauremys mutica]